jgi:hypothetical protein
MSRRVLAICIYCLRRFAPSSTPRAHIMPHVIGGTAYSKTTVCGKCNSEINRRVENDALSAFDFFRSYFGIAGRRGRIRPVRFTVTIDGKEHAVHLGPTGDPLHPVVSPDLDQSGKVTGHTIFGPRELVDATQHAMATKNPNLKWEDGAPSQQLMIFEIEDLSRPTLRRLAAKVAFEHFASITEGSSATTSEYNDVRGFILTGREARPLCGLVHDRVWWTDPLNFPVLSHASLVIGHPLDRVLGAFVVFFGVYYYWVALSDCHSSTVPFAAALIEYPTERKHVRPSPHMGPDGTRVAWDTVMTSYLQDIPGSVETAKRNASTKFVEFIRSVREEG